MKLCFFQSFIVFFIPSVAISDVNMKETEGEFRVPFDPFLLVSVFCFFVFRFVFGQVLSFVLAWLLQFTCSKSSAFSFQTDPLDKLMADYCEFRKLPRSRLKFFFDGDELKGSETPEQLDMENEDVIDVRVKQFTTTSTSVRTNSA